MINDFIIDLNAFDVAFSINIKINFIEMIFLEIIVFGI